MKLIPFEPGHLKQIAPQPAQAAELMVSLEDPGHAARAAEIGPAITGVVDGEVIFCVGMAKQWPGRHVVWSVMSYKAGAHMLRIVRVLNRLIGLHKGAGRLELIVRADFAEGCRLATKFMGFTFHHFEERFLPDGSDANIYVRYM